MIANLSKLLTVQLSPLLALASTFLILFTLLGPVPVFNESISLVSINTISASSSRNNIRSVGVRRHFGKRDSIPEDSSFPLMAVAADKVEDVVCNSFDCRRRRAPRLAAYMNVKRAEEKVRGPVVRLGLLGMCP